MPHYLTSKGPASINYGLMGLRLPSGKEVVFTTHAEKNWDSYLLLFAIAPYCRLVSTNSANIPKRRSSQICILFSSSDRLHSD